MCMKRTQILVLYLWLYCFTVRYHSKYKDKFRGCLMSNVPIKLIYICTNVQCPMSPLFFHKSCIIYPLRLYTN